MFERSTSAVQPKSLVYRRLKSGRYRKYPRARQRFRLCCVQVRCSRRPARHLAPCKGQVNTCVQRSLCLPGSVARMASAPVSPELEDSAAQKNGSYCRVNVHELMGSSVKTYNTIQCHYCYVPSPPFPTHTRTHTRTHVRARAGHEFSLCLSVSVSVSLSLSLCLSLCLCVSLARSLSLSLSLSRSHSLTRYLNC